MTQTRGKGATKPLELFWQAATKARLEELAWPKDNSNGDATKRRNEILGTKSGSLLEISRDKSSLGGQLGQRAFQSRRL
jgi:hypothetical protein